MEMNGDVVMVKAEGVETDSLSDGYFDSEKTELVQLGVEV